MSFEKYIIFGFIAVAVFTIYMALVNFFSKDKTQVRVQKILGAKAEKDDEYRDLTPFAAQLKVILEKAGVDFSKQRQIAADLSRAGYNTETSLIYFILFKRFIQPILLVIGLVILAKLLIFDAGRIKENMSVLFTGLLIIVIGGYGAKLFLTNSAQKRAKELNKTFPDALDLVLICVESGLGVDAAFARVCKEMKDTHPVVASEFDRTRFEMTMMNDRVQALQNFSDRTGSGAVRSLVSSLIQAEKFGTSLIDTIRMISEEQRADRMMNAEAKAARLPALITMPLIFFILPGLFMIILGPVVIKFQEQGGLFGGQ